MSNLANCGTALPRPATGRDRAGPLRSTRSLSIRHGALGRFGQWLRAQHQRRRSIIQLQRLNDWMLRDIGIARSDIAREVDRLLWEQRFATMGQARDARRVIAEDWQDR